MCVLYGYEYEEVWMCRRYGYGGCVGMRRCGYGGCVVLGGVGMEERGKGGALFHLWFCRTTSTLCSSN